MIETLPRLPGLFVTGTDTGVGKTEICSRILREQTRLGRRVGVVKPVATGIVDSSEGDDDPSRLAAALDRPVKRERICPIEYPEPLAPVVAARRMGQPLEQAWLEQRTVEAITGWFQDEQVEWVLVEGVGGWLCPLAEGSTIADLAQRLDYPVLVVARRGLGTLNHTLLTLESIQRRGLRVAGIILNGANPTIDPIAEATNPEELSRRIGLLPLLADLPHRPDRGTEGRDEGIAAVDWLSRAAPPR